jgi:phosphoglycerate dehydrogenase-like enzyme
MLNVAILIGSTRPGRKGEAVARWVLEQAQARQDARYELVDIQAFGLPLLDEPEPASSGNYQKPHTLAWSAAIARFDAFVFVMPEYNHGINAALKNALDFLYREWNGKVAGIVGYGGIGREVARRLAGFEMRVLAVSRSGPKHSAEEDAIPVAGHYPESGLHDALREADFVVLAPPLNDATRGLMGETEFALLKPAAYVVNVARGGVIDYDALLAALRDKRIAGAGLDVFWQEPMNPADPIFGYNVMGTPHIGGATDLSFRGIARKVAENVERLRRGEMPVNCANPEATRR